MIAYFVLTYAFSWALWIPIQPLVLDGHDALIPLIYLGIFGPALVAIGLSAIINPRPREGNRNRATITFIVAWIISALIIVSYYVTYEQIDITPLLVIISGVIALLPAFVVSSFFSSIPGIKNLLATYIRPRGAPGYYLLALVLFPIIWLLGTLVSLALGMKNPVSDYFTLDIELVVTILFFFLMNCIHGGLSEEPGWRGFALPRLQVKFSPLVASLILGVFWAVWHAPARFGGVAATSLEDTLINFMIIALVTVIFTWFYNRTKRSILAPALLHASMNTTGAFLLGSLGAIILLIASMIFLIFKDKMWRKLPPENPAIIFPMKFSSSGSS